MKVLFWSRVDLFDVGGGDKIQMENTAAELQKLGVDVKISTSLNEDPSEFDFIHVFMMDWTPETYFLAKRAKKFGKKLVLSPIHHSVKEVKRFDDEYAFGLRKIVSSIFREQHQRDTMKNIFRSIFNPKKLKPTLLSIFIGLKNMHKKTLKMADVVLVQTDLEAKDLKETYEVKIKTVKISNGVGRQFVSDRAQENILGFEDYILCVGRIEARKNQLNIIKAVEKFRKDQDVAINLVFVGRRSAHHASFMEIFDEKLANNNWITYVEHTPYEDMPALYRFAKVSVSASWFETTGLTSLEALFSGTNVVAAGDRAKEFLGDNAYYCNPGDTDSIEKAIKSAYAAERPTLSENMKSEYTWESTAAKTKNVYERLLNASI